MPAERMLSLLRRIDYHLITALLLGLLATTPLWQKYFIGSHDGILAVYRFFEFDRSIQDGIWIPRWAPDLFFGYGYPFFNFYAPLSYYVAEAFHRLGLGFVSSVTATFTLGLFLAATFMYLLGKAIGGARVGLLAAIAYVFTPYLLVDVYFRGDLAEFFALAWFPAILWAFFRLQVTGRLRYLALAALFFGALITTHNIMALIFAPILAAYILLLAILDTRQRTSAALILPFFRRLTFPMLALVLAFGLSAFFWAPALGEKGSVQMERLFNDPSFYYKTSLLHNSNFISPRWDQEYAYRTEGSEYKYRVEIGLVQLALASLSVLVFGLCRFSPKRGVPGGPALLLLPFFAGVGAVYYALMFPWTMFIWEKVPLMHYVQSPWRLLPIIALSTALLTGFLAASFKESPPLVLHLSIILISILVIIPNTVNMKPRYVDLADGSITVPGTQQFELLTQNLGMTAAGEYLPRGTAKLTASPPLMETLFSPPRGTPDFPLVDLQSLAQGGITRLVERSTASATVQVSSPQETPLVLNITHFLGWRAYVDGRETPIIPYGKAGLIQLIVPPGDHTLSVRFEDTSLRRAGKLISILSLISLIGLGIWSRIRPWAKDREKKPAMPGPSRSFYLLPLAIGGVMALILTQAPGSPDPPPGVRPQFPVQVAFADGVSLLGYDLAPVTAHPGESMDLTLYWRLPDTLKGNYLLSLRLEGWDGKTWWEGGWAATFSGAERLRWIQIKKQMEIPTGAPPGMYKIALRWEGGINRKGSTIQEERLARPIFPERDIMLGPVFIGRGDGKLPIGLKKDFQVGRYVQDIMVAAPAAPQSVELGKKLAFEGYDLEVTSKEGRNTVQLKVYWRVLAPLGEDYAIFAHLMDKRGKVAIFNDMQPEANPYPPSVWQKGELIASLSSFAPPPDSPLEEYQIGIGMYTPTTWQRLPVYAPGGNTLGDTILLSLKG